MASSCQLRGLQADAPAGLHAIVCRSSWTSGRCLHWQDAGRLDAVAGKRQGKGAGQAGKGAGQAGKGAGQAGKGGQASGQDWIPDSDHGEQDPNPGSISGV